MISKRNFKIPVLIIGLGMMLVSFFFPQRLSAQNASSGGQAAAGWSSAGSESDFPVKPIPQSSGSAAVQEAPEEKDPTAQFLVGEVLVEQGSLENYFSRRNNR